MPYAGLADFLDRLEQNEPIRRIDRPIDLTEKLCVEEDDSKVVLFSAVQQRRFPMVGRLMSDPVRIHTALEVSDPGEVARRVEKFLATRDRDRESGRQVKQAPAQQVVRLAGDLDPTVLPGLLLAEAETDQTRRITAAVLLTLDPDSGRRVGTVVPWTVLDDGPIRLVPCWTVRDELASIRKRYAEKGEPMPVAICAGGNPAVRLVAEAPAPCPVDPCRLGAALCGRAIDVVACRTLENLTIPADADLVIEGFWAVDGVLDVRAVTHRINPVVPFAVAGEQAVVRRTLLKGMLPWWRAELPGLVELVLPWWGGDNSVLVGSVEKAYADRSEQIATALADHPTWSDVRLVILLDEAVDLSCEAAMLTALARHADFGGKMLVAVDPRV